MSYTAWGSYVSSVNFPLKQNMRTIQIPNDQLGFLLYYYQKGARMDSNCESWNHTWCDTVQLCQVIMPWSFYGYFHLYNLLEITVVLTIWFQHFIHSHVWLFSFLFFFLNICDMTSEKICFAQKISPHLWTQNIVWALKTVWCQSVWFNDL